MDSADTPDLQTMFDQMRRVCEQMDDPSIKFEEKMRIYAFGVKLNTKIQRILANAERMVVEIVSMNPDGSLKIEPFVSDAPERVGDNRGQSEKRPKNLPTSRK